MLYTELSTDDCNRQPFLFQAPSKLARLGRPTTICGIMSDVEELMLRRAEQLPPHLVFDLHEYSPKALGMYKSKAASASGMLQLSELIKSLMALRPVAYYTQCELKRAIMKVIVMHPSIPQAGLAADDFADQIACSIRTVCNHIRRIKTNETKFKQVVHVGRDLMGSWGTDKETINSLMTNLNYAW